MTALSAVVVLALWLPGRGDGAFISFAVLFGITSGAGIGLGPVLIASISPIGYACLRTHDDKYLFRILLDSTKPVHMLRHRILTYIYSIFICCKSPESDTRTDPVLITVEQPQTWFRKKRGIAGSLIIAGSSLGGVVFPLIVQVFAWVPFLPWLLLEH